MSIGGAHWLRSILPSERPPAISAAAAVHRRIRRVTSSRDALVRSKAAKRRCACCGVVIPAWWSPWNSTVSVTAVRPSMVAIAAARGGSTDRAAGERQQPAARHPAGTRAHRRTAGATSLIGWARASIDSDSFFVSASFSLV